MMPPWMPQRAKATEIKLIKAVKKQVDELYSDSVRDLADNYELIEDVIDMEDSPAVKDGTQWSHSGPTIQSSFWSRTRSLR